MTNRSIIIGFIAMFFFVSGPSVASAQKWLATFDFECLSGGQCNSGGDKLNLMITNLSPRSYYDVRFTFLNSWNKRSIDTVITGITFIDDPASPSILDYSKVAVSRGTDEVDFSPVDKEYATDFNSSTREKGLYPEESVSIKYAFTDAEDDIFDLVDAIGDNSLSIRISVQMIGTDISSALFALKSSGVGPVPIPEPATMFLLGTGLVGIAAVTRKRFNIT